MQEEGADALELNISLLPSNPRITSEENEKRYFEILSNVGEKVSIPIALKMSHYSASLANLISKLSWNDNVSGLVLFNRYYTPDIDIDPLTVKSSNVLSTPEEICGSLRWIALMSGIIEKDLVASTGIHDRKSFGSLEEFRGKLSYGHSDNADVFERTQFMKYYGGLS